MMIKEQFPPTGLPATEITGSGPFSESADDFTQPAVSSENAGYDPFGTTQTDRDELGDMILRAVTTPESSNY
jgi:hypothetical protein